MRRARGKTLGGGKTLGKEKWEGRIKIGMKKGREEKWKGGKTGMKNERA